MYSSSGTLNDVELTQKKASLKLRHGKEVAIFDQETESLIKATDANVIPSLEVQHAHARLELRERQLHELAGSVKDLTSQEDLIKEYADKAAVAAQAVQEFQKRTLFDLANQIEVAKKARHEKDTAQRLVMEMEIKKLESALELEREKEVLMEAEKEAEREANRKRHLHEKAESERVAILQRNVDESTKEKLMKEHSEYMRRFEDNLKEEQTRTKEALRKKLEERRMKKKGIESGKINKLLDDEEIKRLAVLQRTEDEVLPASASFFPAKFVQTMDLPGNFDECLLCKILTLNAVFACLLFYLFLLFVLVCLRYA